MKATMLIISVLVVLCGCNDNDNFVDNSKYNFTVTGSNTGYGDQCSYVGDIKNNRPNGYGKFTYSWGDIYEGHVVNGYHDGIGTMHYINGSVYTGEWKDCYREGKGTITLPDDMGSYEATCKEDICTGTGVFMNGGIKSVCQFSDINMVECETTGYQNCLQGDCLNGYGIQKEEDFTYYGNFVGGLFHGIGEVHYTDGSTMKANFLRNIPYGKAFYVKGDHSYSIVGVVRGYNWENAIITYSDGRPDHHIMSNPLN